VHIVELTDAAEALVGQMSALNGVAGDQLVNLAKRSRTTRRMIFAVAISLALDVILSLGLLFAVTSVQHVSDRLDTQQTTSRQKALCPLYQLFLDSQSAAGRAAAPDPVKYDQSFKVIREGYTALECDTFKGGAPGLGGR
jgi:ferric-dicitrate binding protein FerR (iron transport regulator)